MAEKYIQAQRDGKPGDLPFGNEWVDYKENNQVSTMYSGGIIGKPQKIDWYRLILDPDECKFMAEIIITDPAHPYVLATQASVAPEAGSVTAKLSPSRPAIQRPPT